MDEKIFYYLNDIKKIQHGEYVNPVSCEIDPSNECPANCSFCMYAQYIKTSRATLKWENYLKLVYELKYLGVKSITYTGGGEPICNPRFNDMVDLAHELGFEIGLITNGILLNKVKRPEYFKFIRISLDSSDSEMYKKVKGVDYFDRVIKNISLTVKKNPMVGISYVVCPDNNYNLDVAEELAKSLDVLYIQIKPACINNQLFTDYKTPKGEKVIKTDRFKIYKKLPCDIAHLIGIVTADSGVYYCCQGRGKPNFYIGSIAHESFEAIWRRRLNHKNISINQCPSCRYNGYAKAIKTLVDEGNIFFQHRNFL